MNFAEWYTYEFWRFVFVQQEVGKFAQSFVDFPPMQTAASFNLEAVKEQIEGDQSAARRVGRRSR